MKENEGKKREEMSHYSIGNAITDWTDEGECKKSHLELLLSVFSSGL